MVSETRTRSLGRIALPIFIVGAFSWIFFLPVSHNEILYPLFALLGVSAIVALAIRNPRIDVHLWVITLLVVALSVYGEIRGNGNADPIFSITVFLVAPVMYLTCAAAATPRTLRYLMIAAVIGTLSGCIILLVFVGGEAGLIPQITPQWLVTNMDLKATFRDGASQARSWGLSSLAALGPIWMGSLLVGRHRLLPPWWLRLVCASLALATAVVADRTAIVMVIVISPFIALALRLTLFRTKPIAFHLPGPRLLWIGVGAAAATGAIVAIPRLLTSGPIASLATAVGSFFGAVQASGEEDQSIRADQAWYFIQGWAANPIFGSGFRAQVPGYIRASGIPWSLELQYHLLLFNVGLIGITLALAMLAVGFRFLRLATVTRPEFTPILVAATTGALGMLIANATNPYLAAPGHQWAVFLPLAVAAVALRRAEPPAAIVGEHEERGVTIDR